MTTLRHFGKIAGLAVMTVALVFAAVGDSDAQQPKRYGQSGVFPGGTANAFKKPELLGLRGATRVSKSGVSAKKARIAFQPIRGGLDFHNHAINKFAPAFVAGNRVKVVGVDQNPTHIIRARLSAFETGEAPILQYNWAVIDAKSGKRVQKFVDLERGSRVPPGLRWNGISEIEIKNISQIAADRLVYWLDTGAK
ncbi:MAG: hypothetical protein AAGE89_14835 [Pseudomonadota bacterium]